MADLKSTPTLQSKLGQWEQPRLILLNSAGTEGKTFVDPTESHSSFSGGGGKNYGPS